MSLEFLKKLCETPAVPGFEEKFSEIVYNELKPFSDTIDIDHMGNVTAFKKGKGKNPRKIMLAGHMDEIALVVRYIDKSGFISFTTLGGFDPRSLVAQRVKVWGKQVLNGAIGIKAAHITTPEERAKIIQIRDMFIDVGLPGDKVKKLVTVGDSITLERELIEIGDNVCGKTLDDRVGVYVMIEAFKKMKKNPDDVYAVATVQEEVGVRGARTASYRIDPDIGIAIDVTIAADTPGVEEKDYTTRLGQGTAIKILDSLSISNPKLVKFLRALADRKKIKYQLEILTAGGTDAGAISMTKSGVPSCTISIPNRYTHSVVETSNKKDIEESIKLLTAFLEESDKFKL
jgi:tetrahedral aminopeptidase